MRASRRSDTVGCGLAACPGEGEAMKDRCTAARSTSMRSRSRARSAPAVAMRALWSFIACAAVALNATGALAQATTLKVPPGDDLRALYANVQDIADGKRVAEVSCARCDGMDGISNAKGVPHIAGQRPAYLDLELRTYRAGARG